MRAREIRRARIGVVLFCIFTIIEDMRTFLIIVPEGGMLFEATGIADILMHANRIKWWVRVKYPRG